VDFTPHLDKIQLEGFDFESAEQVLAAARPMDDRTVISLASGDAITLLNVQKAMLSVGDFILA